MENEIFEINEHHDSFPDRIRADQNTANEFCEAKLYDWGLNINNPDVEQCHVAMVTHFKDGTVSIDNLRRENGVVVEITQSEVTVEPTSRTVARQIFDSLDQHFTTMLSETRLSESDQVEELVLDVGNSEGTGLSFTFTPKATETDQSEPDEEEDEVPVTYGE